MQKPLCLNFDCDGDPQTNQYDICKGDEDCPGYVADKMLGKYFDYVMPDISNIGFLNLSICVRGDGNAFQAIFTTDIPFTFIDVETYYMED